jgi:hypothetical protein
MWANTCRRPTQQRTSRHSVALLQSSNREEHMTKVPVTVEIPAPIAEWVHAAAEARDRSVSVLVAEAWEEHAAALGAISQGGEQAGPLLVMSLYLQGRSDLARLAGSDGPGELSLRLPEQIADAIDEQAERLDVAAAALVAWCIERAFMPVGAESCFS